MAKRDKESLVISSKKTKRIIDTTRQISNTPMNLKKTKTLKSVNVTQHTRKIKSAQKVGSVTTRKVRSCVQSLNNSRIKN